MVNNTAVILGNTKLNYSWFVLTYRQGLKLNGYEVFEIDYKTANPDKIFKKLSNIKPKYVFTHLTFHSIYPVDKMLDMFEDLRKRYDIKFIHTLGDAREEPRYNKDISSAFDVALINQTKSLKKFEKYWNIPVIFSPYSSLTYKELGSYKKRLDFNSLVFMGGLHHKERMSLLNPLMSKMNLKIFATQSSEDMRHVSHDFMISNKAILSVCTGYDITHYNEVRPWQILGSGGCMIHKTFDGEDDMIPNDLYYQHNLDSNQVKETYERILKTDTTDIRKRGFDFIQKYHSSKVRMCNVLKVLEGKQYTTKSLIKEFI